MSYRSVEPEVLKAFIDSQSLRYKKTANSFIFDCPRCGKKDKLYIRKKDGVFVCWVCRETDGFQGKPEYALSELTDIPINEIQRIFYGEGIAPTGNHIDAEIINDLFSDDDEEIESDPLAGLETFQWPLDSYTLDYPHAARGVEYLKSRGISADIASQYNIRFSPAQRRVMFPVEFKGNLYGWQARAITDIEPKILSSKNIPRDKTLMYGDRLIGSEHAVLCEGPVDALKAHLCGGNIATMGKAVSAYQIQLIKGMRIKKIYLALDPDAADEMNRLLNEFSDLECYDMQAPSPYKDLGEMELEEVLELFRSANRVNCRKIFVFFRK